MIHCILMDLCQVTVHPDRLRMESPSFSLYIARLETGDTGSWYLSPRICLLTALLTSYLVPPAPIHRPILHPMYVLPSTTQYYPGTAGWMGETNQCLPTTSKLQVITHCVNPRYLLILLIVHMQLCRPPEVKTFYNHVLFIETLDLLKEIFLVSSSSIVVCLSALWTHQVSPINRTLYISYWEMS